MAINRGQILFTGRLANMVGQRIRGEYALRKWVSPTNPQTALQTLFRDRMSEQVTAWMSLYEWQRELWRQYALTQSTPETTYDGYTLFLSMNLRCKASGQLAFTMPPIGKVFNPFTLTSNALSVAQNAPGSSSINLTFNFANIDLVEANRGGVVVHMALPVGSRQMVNCPQQIIGSYDMEPADVSPKMFTIDTGLNSALFPRTFYFRLHAVTQVGRSAGYTDWTGLEFAAAP